MIFINKPVRGKWISYPLFGIVPKTRKLGRGRYFVSIVAEKKQQYRQNRVVLGIFYQGLTPLATKIPPFQGFL